MRSPRTTRVILLATALTLLAVVSVPLASIAQTSLSSSLLVKLIGGLTLDQQAQVIARNGGIAISSIPALRLHVIQVVPADLPQVLANYQADPQVVNAEENKTRQSQTFPADPLYPNQWSLPKIGWDLVFGTVTPPGSAIVAVLDTGIDAQHPDLAGSVIPGTSILDGSSGTTDPSGHGTWVAGIVAARTDAAPLEGIAGVAYAGVRVMPVTVLDVNGLGQDSDVIAGVIWAADHGADVIVMAFSNPGFSQNLQDAIDYAWSKNVVLVAATGNDALNTPTFPAGDRGVMGVSGTDPNDTLVPFSSYGQSVFIAAPATDIQTTDIGDAYSVISGTSASAAIVAGAAAFMKAVEPTLTNGIIVGRLARMADPAGTQDQSGNGRINMARALADTGTDFIQPAGAAPVGDGGPFVGPYRAASTSLTSISVGPQVGSVTYGTGGSVTFAITVNGSGNGNLTSIQVTGLPSGTSRSPASKACNASGGGCNFTLTITTTNSTPAGSSLFTVTVTSDSNNNNTASNTGTLIVSKKTVTASVTAANKIYDSNTTATITNCTVNGVVGGDTVTCSAASAAFANKNVGTGKTVTATGITLSGGSAGNYQLSSATATTTADITAMGLTVTGITANNKVYDGNTTAILNTGSAALVGVVSGDAVTLNTGSATGTFANKNVGTNKPVTVAGLTITGTDAGNYTLTQPTGLTADITPKPLTVSGITANNKVYDGTTAATLNIGSAALGGVVSGDTVTLNTSGATATFADKNVGTNKTVTVAGLTIAGADATNYALTQPSGLTANITAAMVTPHITADNKVYDGTTAATILTRTLTGVIGADYVSLVGGTATFADANVGTGKTVTATGLSLSGAQAGNYVLTSTTSTTTADITPAPTTMTLTAPTITLGANGQVTVSVSSSVGTPTGNVTLSVDGGPVMTQPLIGGTTTFTIPSPPVGNRSLSASYPAQGNYAGSSQTGTLAVHYNFTGFFQPVDMGSVFNVVKATSAIPVKFSLSGNQGMSIIPVGYPKVQSMSCSTSMLDLLVDETVTAGNSSLQYDVGADQYIYVWKTDKSWANTCRQFQLMLNDGTMHTANFKFK